MAGRRIDDHSFFAGRSSEGCVFPDGVHVKRYESADGGGELDEYEDTSEKIEEVQDKGEDKIDSHDVKDGYRN